MLTERIEQVLSGTLGTVGAPHEAAWHALWHEHALGELSPIDSAFVGGAMADRLSYLSAYFLSFTGREIDPDIAAQQIEKFLAVDARR